MTTILRLWLLAALLLGLLGHCRSSPPDEPVDKNPSIFFEPVGQSSSIYSELAAELSPGAAIVSPRQTEHQRWQAYASPTYSVIVEVATEEDVQKTVRFANKHHLAFLAVDGAHGQVPSLAAMRGGVAISFIKIKHIEIDTSGEFADIGPGLTNGELVRGLWAKGKQTTTGICLCSGITGIMLGGGHGYLQGLYGLLADQILEARVVLADGSYVTASPDENRDLFWALRGAGHNFGIVTSLRFKVYERFDEWSEFQMTFSGDDLEKVFDLSNDYVEEADHPAELTLWHKYLRIPDINDDSIIQLSLIYRGTLDQLEPYAAPFRSIGPLVETRHESLPYPEIFGINKGSESDAVTCDKGLYRHLSPTYLMRHNSTSLRRVYDIFNNVTAKYPDIAATSLYMIEGYSTQGVTAVPSEDSATPFRDFPLLLTPQWGYKNAAYADDLRAATKDMRRILVEGSGSDLLSAYVNYAFGDETLPEVYGHEPWRLQRLRDLKAKYDPRGAFSFYEPIDGGSTSCARRDNT